MWPTCLLLSFMVACLFLASCKGHRGFLNFPFRTRHGEIPYEPFISINRLPCKSHRRDIGIYVIFKFVNSSYVQDEEGK